MPRKTAFDKDGKWRSVTVAFRASKEEAQQIKDLARLSGLTKQEYMIRKLTDKEVRIQKSPKTYYELKHLMVEILARLKQFEDANKSPGTYLLETINHVTDVLDKMREKEDEDHEKKNT